MKTTGVRCVPKFGLLFFLGHPNERTCFTMNINSQNLDDSPFHLKCSDPALSTLLVL